MNMKFENDKIIVDRELSDLDRFTIDFVKVLKKHAKYVIVSGYVSILLGRSRVSEDVDLIVPKMDFEAFKGLLSDLRKSGFYCLNADKEKIIYSYLTDNFAIRFAKNDTVIPNMEFKFAKNKFDDLVLKNHILVIIKKNELIISQLELQIAFKEKVLKSPKDLEDAKHIREIGKGKIDLKLIKKYEAMLDGFC